MIFHQLLKGRLNAIADCLDAQFRGIGYDEQNPADKGELTEIFVKEALAEILANQFDVVRGGKIVDINGAASGQMDIVLTGKSALRLFKDKGLYPIETVFGVLSVKSTLTTSDFKNCVAEFKLPNKTPQFDIFAPYLPRENKEDDDRYAGFLDVTIKQWRTRCPYKVLFAYAGNISEEWSIHLVELLNSGKAELDDLPDVIVVNKLGWIMKTDATREPPLPIRFSFLPCSGENCFHPFRMMLTDIHQLTYWDRMLMPDYQKYVDDPV